MAPAVRRRRLLAAVWAAFALLAAGAALLDASAPGPPPAPPARLAPFAAAELGAVEIVAAGGYHRFERDAEGRWFRHAHDADPAAGHVHDAGAGESAPIARAVAAFLASPAVAAGDAGEDRERYGVAVPRLFVALYRPGEDAPLARYLIGRPAPGGGRYVLPAGSAAVFAAAGEGVAALLALAERGVSSGRAPS